MVLSRASKVGFSPLPHVHAHTALQVAQTVTTDWPMALRVNGAANKPKCFGV
jgi:hypothetical protein